MKKFCRLKKTGKDKFHIIFYENLKNVEYEKPSLVYELNRQGMEYLAKEILDFLKKN